MDRYQTCCNPFVKVHVLYGSLGWVHTGAIRHCMRFAPHCCAPHVRCMCHANSAILFVWLNSHRIWTKMYRTLFFFFPPHLCDPIPVQVHTAFCGDVIMFTLTHAVVQRAVWTACEWDAMWEPTLHQSEPSLSVNSIIQGWTATSKPYKSCKFLPVEAHTCAPPL